MVALLGSYCCCSLALGKEWSNRIFTVTVPPGSVFLAVKLTWSFALSTVLLGGSKYQPSFWGVTVTLPFKPSASQVPSALVVAVLELPPDKTTVTPATPFPDASVMIPEILYS